MNRLITDIIMSEGKFLYSFCYHLTGNRSDADDLYQDTFLKAIEKMDVLYKLSEESAISDMPQARTKIKNYLIGISANLWRNQWRKRNRRKKIVPTDDREEAVSEVISNRANPEADFIREETLGEIHNIVNELPDKFRMVITMYYSGGMSTKEIASKLKIPEATVRSRLSKARKKIKEIMEGNGYDE